MKSAAIWQLAWGIVSIVLIYLVASGSKRKFAIGVVLALIPFQIVDTRFASSSVLMAYALAIVLLIDGGFKLRMIPTLSAVALAYLISLSQASREIFLWHVVFVFQFFSCLIVFLLAYNYARLVRSDRSIVDLLLLMNVLCIGYCGLQLIAGPGNQFVPFGVEAFAFNINRTPGDPRLVGPFDNPGSTSGYFVLAILVCAVELIYATGRRRIFVQGLSVLNLMCIVATGNRAAFVVMVLMFPAMLFVFRNELGVRRTLQYVAGGAAVLVIASVVAINYTSFGTMYERMGRITETENGVPSTRALTWPVAIEKIRHHPWLGEGPFFVYPEAAEKLGWLRTAYDNYPHSLYLYLLRTVGIVGLVAVLWFFGRVWFTLYRTRKRALTPYRSGLIRLGLLLIPAFLIAQITLEFNRPSTMDYAQFIFALMGLLIGLGDREEQVQESEDPVRNRKRALPIGQVPA
jgi:O-antigen ligase